MTKLDDVARAICEHRGLKWEDQANFMTSASGIENEQAAFREDARAAITTYESGSPSEEEIEAAARAAFARNDRHWSTVGGLNARLLSWNDEMAAAIRAKAGAGGKI